jgi:predicted transcriptional regulator
VPDKYVDHLLEKYKEELYQLRYNFRYESVDARWLKNRLQEQFEQDRLMQRLEGMTAPDEDPDAR